MLVGVGIDIATIDRVGSWWHRFSERELSSVFDAAELGEAKREEEPETHLAICFAVKEAVAKALSIGIGPVGWTEIMTSVSPGGALGILLRGAAARLALGRGIAGWWGAWSRLGQFVMACVIAAEPGADFRHLLSNALVASTNGDGLRSRARRWGGRLTESLLAPSEREAVGGRRDVVPGVAARLAARYAVGQMLYGREEGRHDGIRVGVAAGGAPYLILDGRSAERARCLRLESFQISLTHEGPYAAAIVCAVGGDRVGARPHDGREHPPLNGGLRHISFDARPFASSLQFQS